jgi:hypothetical protein
MIYIVALCTGMKVGICTRVCIWYVGMHVRMVYMTSHSIVHMESRITRYVHVLPCPHNVVHAVLGELPSSMREPSGRLLSLLQRIQILP